MNTSISASIHADLLRRIERAAEVEQKWIATQHHYLPLFQSLVAIQAALSEGETLETGAGSFGSYVSLNVTGSRSLLTRVWRSLRLRGWYTADTRPAALETSWSGSFYLHTGTEDGGRVPGVEVYLSFSSTVCRRVKVGTKLVEQPIYEVRCSPDGEEVA